MLSDLHPGVTIHHQKVMIRAKEVADAIHTHFEDKSWTQTIKIHPVPRGGVPAAYAVMRFLSPRSNRYELCVSPQYADCYIDDLIDSGITRERFAKLWPDRPFFALFDKQKNIVDKHWLIFPWEGNEAGSIEDATTRLLQYIGEDTERDGLKETPARVARAWKTWTQGYTQDVQNLFKMFEETADYNEIVLLKNLPFYSHCEHHLAPFFGTASIAYIPNGKIVGLSKLNRVLDAFSQRLQVQERMTKQIANALMEGLNPKGVAVQVRARHLCMESRGIQKQGHETVTQALSGVFFDDARTRAEFMELTK